MRRALVTGCSRGIGRAVTEMLLDEGWEVVGISRTRPALIRPGFEWFEADISEPPCRHAALDEPLDALVHCAAVRGAYGPLVDGDADTWEQTIQANLLGTYRVVRLALPALAQSDDPRILLFSGGGAFGPSENYSAYGVSKAGVVALMDTLAAELQAAGSPISINCVAPGFVATSIHDGTPDAARQERDGAMGDVLGCVRHLLSPATRGLTGRTIAAQYDDWAGLSSWTVPLVMETPMGTRTRHTLTQCQRLVRRAT